VNGVAWLGSATEIFNLGSDFGDDTVEDLEDCFDRGFPQGDRLAVATAAAQLAVDNPEDSDDSVVVHGLVPVGGDESPASSSDEQEEAFEREVDIAVEELQRICVQRGFEPLKNKVLLACVARALSRILGYTDPLWKAACHVTIEAIGLEFGAHGLLIIPLAIAIGCTSTIVGEFGEVKMRRYRLARAREVVTNLAHTREVWPSLSVLSLLAAVDGCPVQYECEDDWPRLRPSTANTVVAAAEAS
jgi:hypothetical protein